MFWSYPCWCLEYSQCLLVDPRRGFEPRFRGSKPLVLPLNERGVKKFIYTQKPSELTEFDFKFTYDLPIDVQCSVIILICLVFSMSCLLVQPGICSTIITTAGISSHQPMYSLIILSFQRKWCAR